MKPYSAASERNRGAILERLLEHVGDGATVLEIGGGTGQHAVHFARALPGVTWIVTDVEWNLAGIEAWVREAALSNLRGPFVLDVTAESWPVEAVDHVFSANTAHIMSWSVVGAMFEGVGRVLRPGGRFLLYGPFNRRGAYTSESNRRFDASLRAQDPAMGVRDDVALEALAVRSGLSLVQDHPMPANNRMLVFTRE